MKNMKEEIINYHLGLLDSDREICEILFQEITLNLPDAEYKIWHRHPVWFLNGNPIVGYHKLKNGMRILFWSGQSFEEPDLKKEGSFKAAEYKITAAEQINKENLKRWLEKAGNVQWDYKNIVKRKGILERLK
jgi:hypothetical protein